MAQELLVLPGYVRFYRKTLFRLVKMHEIIHASYAERRGLFVRSYIFRQTNVYTRDNFSIFYKKKNKKIHFEIVLVDFRVTLVAQKISPAYDGIGVSYSVQNCFVIAMIHECFQYLIALNFPIIFTMSHISNIRKADLVIPFLIVQFV